MADSDYDLFLKNLSKHISLDEKDIEIFTSAFKLKKVKKSEFLLQTGDVCRYEYFVNKGCLRTYTIDPNGFEHILMFSVEDWWAGDMYSFLTQTPALFNIDALEESEVFQIDYPSIELLYKKVPKFERYFRIIIQNSFITQQRRIIQNISSSAEDRFLQFKNKYPDLIERIPQKHIAAYLGITPEFFSVLRKKLEKK
ncbi:MAG: Crp/Fnr family transcriptional regulator [Ignavibacteria bacterium]